MSQSHEYKNAVLPGIALPLREEAARQMNVTSDIKIDTVQSVLFKFSALASAPWHEGHAIKTVTDEQYVLQTVGNSSPFVVDLICFQRKEGHRKAIGALVQSFQFPNPFHNLSVCACLMLWYLAYILLPGDPFPRDSHDRDNPRAKIDFK